MLLDKVSEVSVLPSATDMSYIPPKHFLRVTQKAKSHLEILNEPILVTVTS